MLINLKKFIDFLNEPKWANRIILYTLLFEILFLALYFFFLKKGFFHTHIDSARYMISALVQSEAAIVALVITLTLVVVQLASTSYSTRVIEVFIKTPDLWILLFIYGISIFHGLLVLKLIGGTNTQAEYLFYMERQIAFSYFLGVFVYVSLIPYILNTLNLLRPSMIIKILSEKITKKEDLKLEIKKNFDNDKNPFQSILDIMNCSLEKNDYETSKNGLKAMENCMKYIDEIIQNHEHEKREKVSIIFIDYFRRIGNYAIKNSIIQSTAITISNLYKKGIVGIERNQADAVFWAIWSLGIIGAKIENKKGFPNLSCRCVFYINCLGKMACKNQLENATWWAIYSMEKIGEITVKNQNRIMELIILENLEEIRTATIEQGQVIANRRAAFSIKSIKTNYPDYNKTIMEEERIKLKELANNLKKNRDLNIVFS